MPVITSVKNPAVQAARSLRDKSARDRDGLFLCEGEHMAGEAIRAGGVQSVFVDESRDYAALLALLAPETPVYCVPAHVLEVVSQVKTPQGIAAVVRQPERVALDQLGDRVLLLENVQDPGNVGTILRTLDAAGFDGCILTSGCADPFSPKTLRATMGSIFRVPLTTASDASETLRALNKRGYATLAGVLDGAPFYERSETPTRICVVIGNEGAGITPETAAACTHRYRLPMRGGAESLNAAIAAAIFMYDLMRRP